MREWKEVSEPGGVGDDMALKAAPLEVETATSEGLHQLLFPPQPGRGLSPGEPPVLLAEGLSASRNRLWTRSPLLSPSGPLPVGQGQAGQQASSGLRQGKLRPHVAGLPKPRGRQGIS